MQKIKIKHYLLDETAIILIHNCHKNESCDREKSLSICYDCKVELQNLNNERKDI
jgi:hypothetical protein